LENHFELKRKNHITQNFVKEMEALKEVRKGIRMTMEELKDL
jgi:hypothetical protein